MRFLSVLSVRLLILLSFLSMGIPTIGDQEDKSCLFEAVHTSSGVSRLLRAIKQLWITIDTLPKQDISHPRVAIMLIIEIQLLNVCAAMFDLDRMIKQKDIVLDHCQADVVFMWWYKLCCRLMELSLIEEIQQLSW